MAVSSQQLIELTREIAENLAISIDENERNRDPDYIPEEENEDQDETNDRFDEEIEIENNNNELEGNKSVAKRQGFTVEFKIKAVDFYRSMNNNAYRSSKLSMEKLGVRVSRQNFMNWEACYGH